MPINTVAVTVGLNKHHVPAWRQTQNSLTIKKQADKPKKAKKPPSGYNLILQKQQQRLKADNNCALMIRRGSAEEEVRKHRDRAIGACKQISEQRRRVDASYDPSMVTALQHGTWMDEEGFKKACIREKKKRGDIHQPFYGT